MKKILLRSLVITVFLVFCQTLASAQTPPRFYWKSLAGANAVPVIYQSISGNVNPLDPAFLVTSDADIDADLVTVGFAKLLPLFERTATIALLAPMGRMSSSVNVGGLTTRESAKGVGDPTLELAYNLIGPKALMNIPDMLRYEPKFSLDVVADFMLPVGEYDNKQSLNIGQNRWYGRVGLPVIFQIGSWVPGKRTTLEVLPWVWWFGDNNDYLGETLSTDPMFQLEGHLTRDLTETLWASLDATWRTGGKSTLAGQDLDSMNTLGVGFTLGYQVTDNLGLTLGYMTTVNDSSPGDIKMDRFLISLTYGWHKIIEGQKRLGGAR